MRPSPCLVLSLAAVAYSLPIMSRESVQLIKIAPEISPALGLGGKNSCLGLGISVCDPITVTHDNKPPTGKDLYTDQIKDQAKGNGNDKPPHKQPLEGNHEQNQVKGNGDNKLPNGGNRHKYPVKGSDDNKPPHNGNNQDGYPVQGDEETPVPQQYHGSPPKGHPGQEVPPPQEYHGSPPPTYPEHPQHGTPEGPANPPAWTAPAGDSPDLSLIDLSPKIKPVELVPQNGCLGIGISACDPITVDGHDDSGKGDGASFLLPQQSQGGKEEPALGLLGIL